MTATRRGATLTFAAFAFSIHLLIYLLTRSTRVMDHPAIVWAGATDLLATIPLLYFFLVVRRGFASPLTLGPVFMLSLWGANFTLPVQWPLLRMASGPIEIGLIGGLFWRLRQAIRSSRGCADRLEMLEQILSAALPVPSLARLISCEVATFYYALCSWGANTELPQGARAFSYAEGSGLTLLTGMAIGISLVEGPGVHFLARHWSNAAAWVFTALSVYGLIWLLGLRRAAFLRPYYLLDGVLHLRVSYLWTVQVPVEQIVSVSRTAPLGDAGLRAVWINDPQLWLELKAPVQARGLYGMSRQVSRIALAVDAPEELRAALG